MVKLTQLSMSGWGWTENTARRGMKARDGVFTLDSADECRVPQLKFSGSHQSHAAYPLTPPPSSFMEHLSHCGRPLMEGEIVHESALDVGRVRAGRRSVGDNTKPSSR